MELNIKSGGFISLYVTPGVCYRKYGGGDTLSSRFVLQERRLTWNFWEDSIYNYKIEEDERKD